MTTAPVYEPGQMPHRFKVLFMTLVRLIGGCDAAGAMLGISHQRVSQLQSLNHADMPTLMQVHILEMALGQPIVSGALARLAVGRTCGVDLIKEAAEAVAAVSSVLDACVKGATQRDALIAVSRARKELDDVAASLSANAA